MVLPQTETIPISTMQSLKSYMSMVLSTFLSKWKLAELKECRPSSLDGDAMGNFCALHRGCIRDGRCIPGSCEKCGVGTKTESRLCTRCVGSRMNEYYIKRVEARSKKYYRSVMKELVRCVPHANFV